MTLKAGTILYNPETKLIGLVYREKNQDISFPKGHLEVGETLEECAIRETKEETGRNCIIIKELEPITYTTNKAEEVKITMYLAHDNGPTNEKSPDPEICLWTEINNVEKVLSYNNLKEYFIKIKKHIK